jgi:signal transduction histidine kinase
VVLVRTVLDPPAHAGGSLAEAFRRHGGADVAVSEWLAVVDRASAGAAAARATVVDRLAEGFSVAGVPPSMPVPEAAALAAAVAAAQADRTERERFSAAVATARLEALREFAYGAGHEINNPLANIATRAQSLLLDEQSPERRRRLAVIVDQAFRGRDMIGGLMVFARPPKPAPSAVAVDGVLTAVIEAVRPLAVARDARLECSPPPTPLEVFVDEAHVVEAVRLVTINALEAEAVGGRVTLEARRRADPDGPPRCEIIVADAGLGMDADTLRRAFDPFFSGREAGRGIGLGLPKAWRLVEINGGAIAVDSGPGRGTRVSIALPLAAAGR